MAQDFVHLVASLSDLSNNANNNAPLNYIYMLKQIGLQYPDKLPITTKTINQVRQAFKYRLNKQKDECFILNFSNSDKCFIDTPEAKKYIASGGNLLTHIEHNAPESINNLLYYKDNIGLYESFQNTLGEITEFRNESKTNALLAYHIQLHFLAIDKNTHKYTPARNINFNFDQFTHGVEDFANVVVNQMDFTNYDYVIQSSSHTIDWNDFCSSVLGKRYKDHINLDDEIVTISFNGKIMAILPKCYTVSDYDAQLKDKLDQNHIKYNIQTETIKNSIITKKYPNFYKYINKIISNDKQSPFCFKLTDELLVYAKALFTLYNLKHMQDNKIPFNILQPLAKLIYYQQQKFGFKQITPSQQQDIINKKLAKFNKSMHEFFKHYSLPKLNANNDFDVSYVDLAKYASDIITKKPVDDRLFNIIANSTNLVSNHDIIIDQADKFKLQNGLQLASYDEKQKALSILPKDIANQVNHVYVIKPKHDLSKFQKHRILTHGTVNRSILSILAKGLLDSGTLVAEHNKYYDYTGSGLGVGIYFTRPDQIGKSLNYTDSHNISYYAFACDVGYNNKIDVSYYDSSKNLTIGDLLWAHGVGSFDRDELLVPDGKQVNIKYLYEFMPQD